jgi:gas vesicle protein
MTRGSFYICKNLSEFIQRDKIDSINNKQKYMSNKKGGLLFGVIVGTILGVLFAPKKGKDLRGKLKKEFESGGLGTETLKENFTAMGEDIAQTAQKIYEKPEVQKNVKKGKEYLKEVGNSAKEQLEEAGLYDKGMQSFNQAKEQIQHGFTVVKKKIGEVQHEFEDMKNEMKQSEMAQGKASKPQTKKRGAAKAAKGRATKASAKTSKKAPGASAKKNASVRSGKKR